MLQQHQDIDCSFKLTKNETEYEFENLFEDCYELNENEIPASYSIKSLLKFFNENSKQTFTVIYPNNLIDNMKTAYI